MLRNLGANWPRRSTLLFVAFAIIVLAFTAFALSWSGLSGLRNSATADPATVPLIIAIPNAATPKPSHATHHSTARHPPSVSKTRSSKPALTPKPTPATKAKASHKPKAAKPTPKPTHTPKPKPTHTPKPKRLYVHTPRYVHKPQYPPAPPPVTIHGVLAGAAGRNYVAR